jgi:putative addiction module component (TIGR02574 family)
MIFAVSPKFAELRDEALQLPEKERLRLADELYESIEPGAVPDLSPAWKAEISRRLKSIEDGTAVLLDHDHAMRELKEKHGF